MSRERNRTGGTIIKRRPEDLATLGHYDDKSLQLNSLLLIVGCPLRGFHRDQNVIRAISVNPRGSLGHIHFHGFLTLLPIRVHRNLIHIHSKVITLILILGQFIL